MRSRLHSLLAGIALCTASAWLTPASAADIDFAAIGQKYAAPASSPATGDVFAQWSVQDQADYARYVVWQREYSRRGWEWHLFSTQLLFSIVLVIVAFGLWITYQQFKRDYTGRRTPHKAEPAIASSPESAPPVARPPVQPSTVASTLKIGPAGLELTSQVIGLMVLAMSLAFFYFYVKEVYPMRELARESAAAVAASAPPSK